MHYFECARNPTLWHVHTFFNLLYVRTFVFAIGWYLHITGYARIRRCVFFTWILVIYFKMMIASLVLPIQHEYQYPVCQCMVNCLIDLNEWSFFKLSNQFNVYWQNNGDQLPLVIKQIRIKKTKLSINEQNKVLNRWMRKNNETNTQYKRTPNTHNCNDRNSFKWARS